MRDLLMKQELNRIKAWLPELVDKMYELAMGIQTVDDKGAPAYSRPPDRHAIDSLINRVLGRPGGAKDDPPSAALDGRVVICLPPNGRDAASGSTDRAPTGASDAVPGDAGGHSGVRRKRGRGKDVRPAAGGLAPLATSRVR